MTDRVNVPPKPTYEMQMAGSLEMKSNALYSPASIYLAMLAAAPKAEPVSDPYKLDVEEQFELAQGLAANCGYTLVSDAQSAEYEPAQPEAQKVGQESFGHWVEHTVGETVFIRNGSYVPKGENYTVTPLYTHPAPASDEMLEAVSLVSRLLANSIAHYGHPKDEYFGVGATHREARNFLAKHKGPQS